VPLPPDASFEDHLKALEKVVLDLEGDTLSLESSIGRYKEGVSHLAACRTILDAAEQRLCELVATPGGAVEEVPLRVGPEGLEGLEDAPRPGNGPPPAARADAARPRPLADPPRAPSRPAPVRPAAPPPDLPF
jgi:exodeoxyribonuclease VII small subunit